MGNSQVGQWAVKACTFGMACALSTGACAATLSFAAVRDSGLPLAEFEAGSYSYTSSQLLTDGLTAAVSIPTGSASARTSPGVNRVQVDNQAAVDDEFLRANSIGGPFAVSISAWTDRFTITGGQGQGMARVSAIITGEFGPKSAPSYGGGGRYDLFVASTSEVQSLFSRPLEFLVETELPRTVLGLEQNVLTPGFQETGESVAPGSAFGGLLTGTFEFTYGESFHLVGMLSGFANDFGVLNALNSARFGLTAPGNATISTESGFVYAAAVPEPATASLLLAGLILLGGAAHRHGRRSRLL